MKSLITAGDSVSKTYGEAMSQLTIRTDRYAEGVSLTVFVGGHYNSTLSRTFLNDEFDSARIFYAHVRDCAVAGKAIHQIEAEVSALIEAAVAVDVERVAEGVNSAMDEVQQRVTATRQATQAGVGTVDCTWRRVRNTRTQVFRQPLNAVQTRAIRSHRDGVVYAEDGVSWVTLRALAEKGFGTPVRVPGRQIITSVRLNEHGIAVANETEEQAA